jgi:hypothetical protein
MQTLAPRAVLLSIPTLFLREPLLRVRAVLALLIFASFSTLWTAMVLPLSAAPSFLSHTEIGLFGLAGVAILGAAFSATGLLFWSLTRHVGQRE